MVAAAAAPCGGTGREGRVAGGGRLGAHRPYGALVCPPAPAPRKKRLTQISVAVWRDLSRCRPRAQSQFGCM